MTGWLRRHAWAIAVTAAILAIIVGLLWFVVGYYNDAWNVTMRTIGHMFFVRQMFPELNPLHWTPFTYLVFALALFSGAPLAWQLHNNAVYNARYDYSERKRQVSTIGRKMTVVLLVLAVPITAYTVSGFWNNDRDQANSYANATTFVVEDASKLPASLAPLTQGGGQRPDGSPCLFSSVHDVPSCIMQGVLPANWENRKASLTGADIVMSRTSGAVPNTDIMKETLTYLNDGAMWTAIRNGKNKQPIYGIVSWDGAGATQTCRFTGSHALNYAFGGKWGQNLDDTLAQNYSTLLYSHDDMWGYCKGSDKVASGEPVIVIPVTQQHTYARRTTLRSAGILVITGSPSGEPVITHYPTVKAGQFPGPVYPLSLVAKQREMIQWAAGRGNKNRLNFGYEPSDVAVQNGNNSEYLLRDKGTGRLFWVTPLKPRSTGSQLLVAYSLTPADETQSGGLNQQKVYVLPDDDSRVVNVDDMEARVGEAIRNSNPGFFTGEKPGSISEFLPINATTWQAFAELNGRVVFRITVPTDARITPTVQGLDDSIKPPPGKNKEAIPDVCLSTNPKGLTDKQLADCIGELSDRMNPLVTELRTR